MKARWLLPVVIALAACGHDGPRLPQTMSVADRPALAKARDFSSGGFSGVVFIPAGEELDTASLQLAVFMSENHESPSALHEWILAEYRRSPTQQWHESTPQPTEACKVGLGPGPPRPFVAVHVCQGGRGVTACAEADERLAEDVVGACLTTRSSCWEEVCAGRLAAWRPSLETVLDTLLREP